MIYLKIKKIILVRTNKYFGKSINVLINFATLKSGGGQSVGLNFLQGLAKVDTGNLSFSFIVAKGSPLHQFIRENKIGDYFVFPNNPLLRIVYEIIHGSKIINKNKIDIIYTYFGIGFFPKSVSQVIGSADSNLYFPEVDFWVEYNKVNKLKRKIIDNFRIWGLKRANGIIFENEVLEKRGHKLFNIYNTKLIKPSISFDFIEEEYIFPDNLNSNVHKGLFLCGWQRNKNIFLIPETAAILKGAGYKFHFILTAPLDNSKDHKLFKKLVRENKVEDMVFVVGQVKKEELISLYDQIDYVFLLSKLESFSNNIIEAWYFKKPLIISDEDWSRSICKKGAIYVNRDSVKNISEAIISLENNPKKKQRIVGYGIVELENYPTIEQRTIEELNYLKHVYQNI